MKIMLKWTVIIFVIANIMAIIGFGGVFSENTAFYFKMLFFIFLALFVLTILLGATVFRK